MSRLRLLLLATILVSACGGEDRTPTQTAFRDGGTTVVPTDAGEDPGRDGGHNPMGEVCSAFDMSMTCQCEPGQTCGAWTDGCRCIGDARDAGPPRDGGPGTPRDGGTGTPRDGGAGTPRDGGVQPPRDGGVQNRRDAGPNMPGIPVYSGGNCPTFVDRGSGMNTISTPSGNRQFLMALPTNPNGAAVIFTWHWWMGQADWAMDWTGLSGVTGLSNVIVISPVTHPSSGSQWYNSGAPGSNPDLQMFDDVLACLHVNYGVDMDRIYATGHSMGALFLSYLIQHRAQYLAAFAPLSGGQNGGYTTPAWPLPGLILWGGPTDMYGNFSFETASRTLSTNLRNDGSFVMHCVGDFGHQLPPMPDMIWPFLRDHRRNQSSPYAGGLPGGLFPNWCFIP